MNDEEEDPQVRMFFFFFVVVFEDVTVFRLWVRPSGIKVIIGFNAFDKFTG